MSRHGGKLLADQLVVHGADTVFSVPGESFLAFLDGLYDSPIRLITCRHEGSGDPPDPVPVHGGVGPHVTGSHGSATLGAPRPTERPSTPVDGTALTP